MLKPIRRSLLFALTTAIALPLSPPAQAQPVPAAVAACAAQPEICAVAVVGIGAWYVLWRNHATELCTWGGCRALQPHRIGNPDEPYHGQIIDYVWGDKESQAIARCKAIARQAGLRYVKVRQTSKGGKRWECHVDNL